MFYCHGLLGKYGMELDEGHYFDNLFHHLVSMSGVDDLAHTLYGDVESMVC